MQFPHIDVTKIENISDDLGVKTVDGSGVWIKPFARCGILRELRAVLDTLRRPTNDSGNAVAAPRLGEFKV